MRPTSSSRLPPLSRSWRPLAALALLFASALVAACSPTESAPDEEGNAREARGRPRAGTTNRSGPPAMPRKHS